MPSLFNPDYLKHLCQKYGLRPSKKYGQNYLVDPETIDTIIVAAELSKDDTVIEVGPGFGTLTLALASRVEKVVAFEIEKKLEEYWKPARPAGGLENVEIVWGNILKELPKYQIPNTKYKVVANLPYQITSPVIRLFLETEHPPSEMILMVQKEVVERICAQPGDMSLLSVAVQYYAETEIVVIVPRSSFWPVPGVDSAVIKLSLRGATKERRGDPADKRVGSESQWIATPRANSSRNDTFFFKIVRAGFSNRRKLLIKNVESVVGKKNRKALEEVFAVVGLTPQARAQELSVEQWIKLAHFLLEIRN